MRELLLLEYHINQNLPRRYAQWPPSRHFISFPSAASFERMRLAVAAETPQIRRTSAFWITSWYSKNCSICFQRSAALSSAHHSFHHSYRQLPWAMLWLRKAGRWRSAATSRIFRSYCASPLAKNSAQPFLCKISHDSRIWPVSPHPMGYRQTPGSPACQCSPGTDGSRRLLFWLVPKPPGRCIKCPVWT